MTLNWVTNYVINALLGTLNNEGPVEKYFVPIAVSRILKSNKPLKCKVVQPSHFFPKLIEYFRLVAIWKKKHKVSQSILFPGGDFHLWSAGL